MLIKKINNYVVKKEEKKNHLQLINVFFELYFTMKVNEFVIIIKKEKGKRALRV